jgi:hypothetical protein
MLQSFLEQATKYSQDIEGGRDLGSRGEREGKMGAGSGMRGDSGQGRGEYRGSRN